MKVLLSLLLFCFSYTVQATPAWYGNQSVPSENNHIYTGYGSGKTLKAAKLNALNDISSQISINVSSKMELTEGRENNTVSQSFSSISKLESSTKLKNVKTTKLEKVNGLFFIMLEYQHLSFLQEFNNKVSLESCENEPQHPYLKHTPFFEMLNTKLPCQLDIGLIRKNSQWMLSYKEALIALEENKFFEFYTPVKSSSFIVVPSSHRLQEGETFSLTLKSETNGYISLFNVYGDGIVSLLQENIPVTAQEKRTFPTGSDEIIFEAGLLEKGKESIELFIALYSQTPQNHVRYTETNAQFLNNDQYQFESLLQRMEKDTFSVAMVKVIPSKD